MKNSMTRPANHWLLMLALLGLTALPLACGNDDDDDDDVTTANDDDVTSNDDDDTTDDDDDVADDDDDMTEECPEGTTALPAAPEVCVVQGEILDDLHLHAGKEYLLRGGVFVGDDTNETVMHIDAGVTVFGEAGVDAVAMLVIRRGSKIMAEGAKDAPIVFTSSKEAGERVTGDWGGLILNGRAPVNTCPAGTALCEAEGEGGTGTYGGNNAADNSGVLKYVRIEFAGKRITETNELNGLALQGVGSGTVLDYIQIHRGADDAIEFFGGTVDARHLVLTAPDDDGLDWTFGWTGRVQHLVMQQHPGVGNQGIEADSNEDDNDATPRSHPVLSHMTFIGAAHPTQTNNGNQFRRGTAVNAYNFIITGFNGGCLDIDSKATFANAHNGGVLNGQLTMEGSIIDCAIPFVTNDEADKPETPENDNPEAAHFTVPDFFNTLNAGNSLEDAMLRDATNVTAPDFRPAPGSPALSGAVFPGDPFFENKSFRGGVDPDNDWTLGWTSYPAN